MAPVSLLSAVAGMAPTGAGAYAYSAHVEAVVENLGHPKSVGVWGHRPLDDRWQLYPGTFARPLPGGRELWRVHLVGDPVDRFALRYDLPEAVRWDNNGGADYRLDAAGAERHDGIGTAALGAPLRVTGWSLERVGLVVDVLVGARVDGTAEVGVHYTLADWASWSDITGHLQRVLPPDGARLWRVTVPMGAGVSGRFAAYVVADGVTSWDNDFERDFRF